MYVLLKNRYTLVCVSVYNNAYLCVMTKQESAYATIDYIREKTDSAILMCSLGKDSLVLLDLMYPKFKRIVCVFMYFVKGLEHVEKWVNWVKAKYPNVEFVQIPHWNISYITKYGLFSVAKPKTKQLNLTDICYALRLKYKIDYVFLGMKKADSMNRRLFLMTYEKNHYENNFLVYPLAEWTQKEILAYMKMHKLPEPVRYGKKASNGIGFNVDCFLYLEKNYPQDLEKIYKVFPLSRRILFEYYAQEERKKAEEALALENSHGEVEQQNEE